eukprot:Gb_17759 [translate_table: standard]
MVANKSYFGPDSEEAECFIELINETFFLSGVFNVGDYLPFLRFLDLQGHERAMKNLHKRRDAFMQALVDEHRQRRSMHGGKIVEDVDFIDVLLSATKNDEIFISINKDNSIIAGLVHCAGYPGSLLHSFELFSPLGVGSTIDMAEGVGLTMPKAIPLDAHINPRLSPNLY